MSNVEKWNINTSEVGKLIGEYSYKSQTFKVYIAKLIPLISFGKAKSKNVVINKGCFLNASKCKPSMASQIKSVNYISIPRASNTSFPTKMSHGAKVTVKIPNHNIDNMSITGMK